MRTLSKELRGMIRSVRYDLRGKRGSVRLLAVIIVLVAATGIILSTGLLNKIGGGGDGTAAGTDRDATGHPAGLAEQYLDPQSSAGFPYLGSPLPTSGSPSASPSGSASKSTPPQPTTETSHTPSASPSSSASPSASPSPSPSSPAPTAPTS